MGGIFQVQLKSVKDLEALATLDPKLWVALSCPVNDLEIDRRTLSLIDYNADDRVRIEEMRNAVAWTLKRLSKPDSLFTGGDLPLNAINTADAEGEKLLSSAKQILANMGESEATTISVAQAANTAKIYGQARQWRRRHRQRRHRFSRTTATHRRDHRLPERRNRPQRRAGHHSTETRYLHRRIRSL